MDIRSSNFDRRISRTVPQCAWCLRHLTYMCKIVHRDNTERQGGVTAFTARKCMHGMQHKSAAMHKSLMLKLQADAHWMHAGASVSRYEQAWPDKQRRLAWCGCVRELLPACAACDRSRCGEPDSTATISENRERFLSKGVYMRSCKVSGRRATQRALRRAALSLAGSCEL